MIERVADVAGCRFLRFEGSRATAAGGGRQTGALAMADVPARRRRTGQQLDGGDAQFIERVSVSGRPRPGIFRYARSPYAENRLSDGLKFVARMVAGPWADQGLLIAKDHYERLGGYAADGHRSEARLLRQLGRSSRTLLRSRIMGRLRLAKCLILSNNYLMKSNISPLADQTAAVRGFSRFYTRKLGIIEPKLLQSSWTLQEARIIYEIAARQTCTATELGHALVLDAGFLSRTLQALQRRQIVARKPSKSDRRVTELTLTARGRAAFADLDRRSRTAVGALLEKLDGKARAAVVGAMQTIEQTLEPPAQQAAPFLLRSHRPGDIGWVISRHGALYANEYGWDISFEALVAEIAAQFIKSFDPSREHCWIAEINGEPAGSIFLVKASEKVAKLRLLLVEERARGLGVGRALTGQCIQFARQTGYTSITLWTQSILVAARGIYQRAGFQRVGEEKHHSFGVDLVGEIWELKL